MIKINFIQDTPPQNTDLEESILSTIIVHPDDDLFELVPSDFYKISHQTIYECCLKLYSDQLPVDLSSLVNELVKKQKLNEVGGATYISGIVDQPTVVDNQYAVKQLQGYANLRRMIELSNSVMKQCYQAKPEDVDSVVDKLQSESLKICDSKTDNFEKIGDVITDTIDHCEQISQSGGITGVPTGYKILDSILCGLQPSDLIILAGRPSMGKTALAVNCMLNSAKLGYAHDFYSLEMARLQIGMRFLSIKSSVDSHRLRSGRFESVDWERMTSAAGELYKYPINIDDSPCATYQEIQRKARKSKKKNDTKVIWIDYLSFLDGDKGLKKVYEVETVTRGLKTLAKELKIPVVLLCQLSRMCEQRSDKRPILSDLRDSGAIEQDADVVMFLYRDEVYNKNEDNPERGIAEIDVAKQRSGPVGRVKLTFLNSFTRFENLATEEIM